MGQDRCGTCTIVSFFSYYRCLCMLQLTMHSPVMGVAVNPEVFTRIRAMLPRRITAPEELTAATELTVQSCCIANPNGGKLSTLGTSRRRFERSHSNSIHRGMRSTLASLTSIGLLSVARSNRVAPYEPMTCSGGMP
jgi:hypothetical protein